MFKRILTVLLFCICASALGISVQAQVLSVTATLTDSDGIAWANGVCFIQTYNTNGGPSYYNGVAIPSNPSCSINSSGVLSATLYNTSTLNPASSQYRFSIQSNTSAQASTFLTPVTVTNMSSTLSALIIAPRFNTAWNAYGYADVEAIPTFVGSTYNNIITTVVTRQCTTIVANLCIIWQSLGSGGGSMIWPSGGAGIPNYNGLSGWGTTYNASNLIPVNFISSLSGLYCSLSGCTLTGNIIAPAGVFGSPSTAAQNALPSGARGIANDCTSTTGVPAASIGYIRCDSTLGWVYSFNNSTEAAAFSTSIANVQVTVGTGAISATCSSNTHSTVTMTGLATTSTFTDPTPTVDLSGVTGWANGDIYFVMWPTANTLNYRVCTSNSGGETPGSSTTWNIGAK